MTSTALYTDRYELTMLRAARGSGVADRRCVFEVFARSLPHGRRYGVAAGIGRLLDALEEFRFEPEQIAYLLDNHVVDNATADWLADYRFTGDIWGYAEGDLYFPGSPVLMVEGTFAEAVLLETLALSILNADSAVAAAASRMACAAGGRPCADMGTRRTSEVAAVASARAAYISGFSATSNLEAGRRYGIPTMGTSAHAFTLLHLNERDAFAAQVAALGPGTTLLVDTYDVEAAVQMAVEVAGPKLGAVRLDSGDLVELAGTVRTQLDGLGAPDTKIVVSSDLDEFAIASLASAPVNSYGVGTALVTGSGAPTANLVYKLVARQGSDDPDSPLLPVAKRSAGKPTRGGRKAAYRSYEGDTAVGETVRPAPGGYDSMPEPLDGERSLLVPLVRDGEIVGREPLDRARERHAAELARLPATGRQLSRGEPALTVTYEEQR